MRSSSKGAVAVDALRRELRALRADNRKLTALMDVLRGIGARLELPELLARIVADITRVMAADRTSLYLVDRRQGELYTTICQGLNVSELRFSWDRGLAGHVARTGETLNIRDAYQDPRFNREIDRKTGYRTRTVLAQPMANPRGVVIGVIQVLNKKRGAFTRRDEEFLAAFAAQAAVVVENAKLSADIESLFESFIRAAATAIDARDAATSGHSQRVAEYMVRFAKLLHEERRGPFRDVTYSLTDVKRLRYGALLHDFGKLGVSERVLAKANKLSDDRLEAIRQRFAHRKAAATLAAAARIAAGPDLVARAQEQARPALAALEDAFAFILAKNRPAFVTDADLERLKSFAAEGLVDAAEAENLAVRRGNLNAAERIEMESHVQKTESFLRAIDWPEAYEGLWEFAVAHHERLDGSGYPRGVKEAQLSCEARMLAIVDMYDALTAKDRPYKPAVPLEPSRKILEDEASHGRLDADLVRFFFEKQVYELPAVDPFAAQEAVAYDRSSFLFPSNPGISWKNS